MIAESARVTNINRLSAMRTDTSAYNTAGIHIFAYESPDLADDVSDKSRISRSCGPGRSTCVKSMLASHIDSNCGMFSEDQILGMDMGIKIDNVCDIGTQAGAIRAFSNLFRCQLKSEFLNHVSKIPYYLRDVKRQKLSLSFVIFII